MTSNTCLCRYKETTLLRVSALKELNTKSKGDAGIKVIIKK